MNTIATVSPTPAFASIDATAGLARPFAPGIGLALAVVASLALWAGLAKIAMVLVG